MTEAWLRLMAGREHLFLGGLPAQERLAQPQDRGDPVPGSSSGDPASFPQMRGPVPLVFLPGRVSVSGPGLHPGLAVPACPWKVHYAGHRRYADDDLLNSPPWSRRTGRTVNPVQGGSRRGNTPGVGRPARHRPHRMRYPGAPGRCTSGNKRFFSSLNPVVSYTTPLPAPGFGKHSTVLPLTV